MACYDRVGAEVKDWDEASKQCVLKFDEINIQAGLAWRKVHALAAGLHGWGEICSGLFRARTYHICIAMVCGWGVWPLHFLTFDSCAALRAIIMRQI